MPRKSRARGCLYLLVLCLAVLGICWFARSPLLTAAGNSLVEDDGPQNAQAIVVLGGDEFGQRITTAAKLAEAGYAPYVLVSGPRVLLGHESDLTIHYAETEGFPASLFRAVPHNADSTRSESVVLGRYLREKGIHKILLVTSNYHTRRAAHLMRLENPGLWVVVVPAPDRNFSPATWWKTRNGQKTFFLESVKTIATRLGM